jgi:6,7-dimethyl-8-ribityllumazine synthase
LPDGSGLRVAIIASRFDKANVVDALIEGAVSTALECGVADESLDLVRVPGAFELPAAARRLAASGRYHALACVGAVIRGETSHFDYVAGEAARGIADASSEFGLPVTFGVITAENDDQARARAGADRNMGRDAMLAAVEMAMLWARLAEEGEGSD